MRYLHSVSLHEKFVASGVYKPFQDGQPIDGIIEYWSIHELPDSARFVRVDVDGRDGGDKRSQLFEAWYSPQGNLERFDIRAYGVPNDKLKQLRATFTLNNNYVEIGYNLNTQERVFEEIKLPENGVLLPQSIFFYGYLLAQASISITAVTYTLNFLDAQFNVLTKEYISSQNGERVFTLRDTEIFGQSYMEQ